MYDKTRYDQIWPEMTGFSQISVHVVCWGGGGGGAPDSLSTVSNENSISGSGPGGGGGGGRYDDLPPERAQSLQQRYKS